jgi:hypothetical protein
VLLGAAHGALLSCWACRLASACFAPLPFPDHRSRLLITYNPVAAFHYCRSDCYLSLSLSVICPCTPANSRPTARVGNLLFIMPAAKHLQPFTAYHSCPCCSALSPNHTRRSTVSRPRQPLAAAASATARGGVGVAKSLPQPVDAHQRLQFGRLLGGLIPSVCVTRACTCTKKCTTLCQTHMHLHTHTHTHTLTSLLASCYCQVGNEPDSTPPNLQLRVRSASDAADNSLTVMS